MLRYLVERISDGVFTELDFPVTVGTASQAFNGPSSFSGTVAPDNGALRYESGELVLDPYASFLHEEQDGVIRGTWIVTRSSFEGDVWQIEGQGFSAFLSGLPYGGEYRGVRVDPVAVARHIVGEAQSQPGADYGVTVTGSSSVRVGTDSDQKVGEALTESGVRKRAVDAAKADLKAKRAAAKASPTTANKNAVTAAEAAVTAAEAAKTKADDDLAAARERQSADGGAWKILWWDTPDSMTEFQDAIAAAGMEWQERSYWDAGHTAVVKELAVVPRVGRAQTGLSFVEGDNIIESVVVEADGSEYANAVVAIGAGEGRKALRVELSAKDSRRRKVAVVDAKEVTKRDTLERLARAELTARLRRYRVAGVRVVNHPNAEFGSFGVGDTITVECDVPWIGRQALLHRITEIGRVSEDLVSLFLGDA